MTPPSGPNAQARCVDALNRVEDWAEGDIDNGIGGIPELLALRHACEALTWVVQHPAAVTPERLEEFVARMCDAVGVDGP